MDCLKRHTPMLRNPVAVLDLGIFCIGSSGWYITARLVKDAAGKCDGKRRNRQTHNQLVPGKPAQTSPPGCIQTGCRTVRHGLLNLVYGSARDHVPSRSDLALPRRSHEGATKLHALATLPKSLVAQLHANHLLLLGIDNDTTISTLGRTPRAGLEGHESVVVARVYRNAVRIAVGYDVL